MSLRPTDSKWNDLICDHPGCDARLDGGRPGQSLEQLQVVARSHGWRCRATADLCSTHNPKPRTVAGVTSWPGRPPRTRRQGGETTHG